MSITEASRGLPVRQDQGARSAASITRRTIWAPALCAYLLGTYFVANGSGYHQGLVEVAAAYAMLALSLDLVAGATGLYSLGHAGLFAIGAYGTAVLADHYHWSVLVALPIVIAASAFVGLLIGALSLRVSGLYFAITTLIFAIIVNVLVSNMSITGGYQGLSSPTFPSFPHSVDGLGSSITWAVSGCLLLTAVVTWSIRSSAMYPVLLAIRDAEPFASSAGVRSAMTKILLFGLSAAIAGLAGWTFSFLGFMTPGQFDATASINVLVMIILGGINTRLGPVIGAVFISLFPVVVSINPLWQEILFGSVFIAVIVFFPEGFVGAVSRLWRVGSRALARSARTRGKSAAAARPASASMLANAPIFRPDELRVDPSAPALEARGISFSYTSGVRVLENVDLVVRRASIHGLIGPNGSGKSTLVNLLSGSLFPEEGTITINGTRAERLPSWHRVELGLMRTFQTASMVSELSTKDNVTIGLFSRYPRIGVRSMAWPMIPSARRDSRSMAATATQALRAVGVAPPWFRTRVADIPHGVEQLTQLAAACVGRPSILVLDEPLAGLSSDEVDEVSAILRGLRSTGVTTIVIEHQTRFIFDVCDDVTVLAAGRMVKAGPAAEVRVDNRVREVYLGQ